MQLSEQHLELLSLKGGCTPGCTGSSEPTLAKMPHCWKSHVVAQMNPSIWLDTMSLGWFIEHIKGLQLRISKSQSTLVPEKWFMPSKQCRDFIWVFTICQSTDLGVSSMQRVIHCMLVISAWVTSLRSQDYKIFLR